VAYINHFNSASNLVREIAKACKGERGCWI